MSDVIAEFVKTRDGIGRLRSLGGVDTFFGKEHVFGELLHEEHEKAGETNKGCFCFKRLGWYGNIVSFEPTIAAVKAFLAHGYIREDLERLRDWYSGVNQTLDCLSLGVYLKHILLRPDIEALLVESSKRHAEAAESERVRLAAIPHAQPPDGAPVYRHKECIEDFAGNSGQPGAWSDVFVADDGSEVVTFGGGWAYYVEGDALTKFGDGERGCPVESRPEKVRQVKKLAADWQCSFSNIVKFLQKNGAELRFGEEFRWAK